MDATTNSMKARNRNNSANNTIDATAAPDASHFGTLNLVDDDKEAKVQKSQAQKLRHFVLFFVLLSGIAFVVGTQQEATHVHTTTSTKGSSSSVVKRDDGPSLDHLQRTVDGLDAKVREHKAKPGMIMEKDPEGMKLTRELQHATHQLLVKRYGRHTFRVHVDVIFPSVIVEQDHLPAEDYLIIELAPIDLIPCSVYNFLEIARTWKSGAFHRNADHVLQVVAHSQVKKSMPFQEYSPEFTHVKGTTGYAGRPSGPGWYVSIMNNSVNHGPGSQQKKNPYEADSLFGRIVHGMDSVVPRIHSTPQMGWLDKENQIQIPKMTILIQEKKQETGAAGGEISKEWVPWTPLYPDSSTGADGLVASQR